MSTETGKVVAALPIGSVVDATKFADGHAFASCGGSGGLFIASQKDGKWQIDQVVKTSLGACTMDLDPRNHIIYLAAAEMERAAPGERRPHTKPNSFMIVEVSQK